MQFLCSMISPNNLALSYNFTTFEDAAKRVRQELGPFSPSVHPESTAEDFTWCWYLFQGIKDAVALGQQILPFILWNPEIVQCAAHLTRKQPVSFGRSVYASARRQLETS